VVVGRSGQHGEPAVPALVQGACQVGRAAAVGDDDRVDPEQRLADQRDRAAGAPEVDQGAAHAVVGLVVRQAAARDDDRAGALAGEQLDEPGLQRGVVLGAREGDGQVRPPGGLRDAGGDRREVRVRDVVHDQPERHGAPPRHRLRVRVGEVAQPLGGGEHAFAQVVAHRAVRAAVDGAGGGRQGHAGLAGDLAQRHGSGHRTTVGESLSWTGRFRVTCCVART
jgi:hypothetical protein